MFDKIVQQFSADRDGDLEYKFDTAVSSSYFKRFVVSWLFWNWKIIFITFFVDDKLVISESSGLQLTRIEWIKEEYSPYYCTIFLILLGPAITAWVVFMFLEVFNVLSYRVTKWSWKKRVELENRFEKKTLSSNKMVSDYTKHIGESKLKQNELTNELKTYEEHNRKLQLIVDEQKADLQLLQLENARLKLKELKDNDKAEAKILTDDATGLIDTIYKAANKEHILEEFNSTYRKIKINNEKCQISNPSRILESLVTMQIFKKDRQNNQYTVTNLGEYFNVLLILKQG